CGHGPGRRQPRRRRRPRVLLRHRGDRAVRTDLRVRGSGRRGPDRRVAGNPRHCRLGPHPHQGAPMTAVLDLALTVLIAVLLLGGGFWMLTTALSMFHARDGLSRINVLSPATGLGLPMIVVGALLQHTRVDGFEVDVLLTTALTVVALLVVSWRASDVLAR